MHPDNPGSATEDIARHYSRGNLLARLRATLLADGADPDHPTIATLAPYDHFHGRGLEATEEVANVLPVAKTDSILDIGSGIGGPARYFAQRFGCRVTGIDLTSEFCEVARALTRMLRLEDRVSFQEGDALTMPFAEASFDGAYSMNVAMNIADKDGLYREIHRVLKPGAWLVLSELARGPGLAPTYPTPWAESAEASFLATPAETRQRLEAHGFTILAARDTLQEAMAYGARSRALVERGEKPPQRAVQLMHGDMAPAMAANVRDGMLNGGLIPVEILCKKSG
jgi:ubiquinone/menaquinone biosynthesis C-methylase UbiE